MTGSISTQLSAQVSEWLPENALVATSVFAAIDARIAAWSARWFAPPVQRQVGRGMPAAITVGPVPRQGWRSFADGVWLDWGGLAPRALALHALGRTELRPKLTPDDENLVAMLGERLARDLAMTLVKSPARAFAEHEEGPSRAFCFKLCGACHNWNLAVAIDAGVLASLRKQQCSPWRPRDAQARPLGEVLGSVPVAFDIALGSVSIELLEFEAIEPGDTIVLDQPIAAPLMLRVAATGAALRDTKLIRQDGQLTLTAS